MLYRRNHAGKKHLIASTHQAEPLIVDDHQITVLALALECYHHLPSKAKVNLLLPAINQCMMSRHRVHPEDRIELISSTIKLIYKMCCCQFILSLLALLATLLLSSLPLLLRWMRGPREHATLELVISPASVVGVTITSAMATSIDAAVVVEASVLLVSSLVLLLLVWLLLV